MTDIDDPGTSPATARRINSETGVAPAHLEQAIALATTNAANGQLPFGALVLIDGQVVATGLNTALRDLDPLAHAEVAAVRNACRQTGRLSLAGAIVVSSCEPCAMCHAVAAAAGVDRIVYAAPKELVGDLGDEAAPAHPALLARMRDALRSAAPGQVVHAPTPDAAAPFDCYRAGAAR